MRGTILGYDGTIGAILGEDGKRYSFVTAEWRGDSPPAARDTIDFVERGSDASQIYPVKGSEVGAKIGAAMNSRLAAAEKALGEADVNDTVGRVKTALATQPQLVLALLLILFASAFNWMSLGNGADQVNKSMVGFVDHASTILGPVTTAVARMEEVAQQARDASVGGAAGIAATSAAQTASTGLGLLKFAPALYLIPAGSMPFSLVDQATAKAAITLGWGAWFVPLAGIGLILTAIGALRRTPGL